MKKRIPKAFPKTVKGYLAKEFKSTKYRGSPIQFRMLILPNS